MNRANPRNLRKHELVWNINVPFKLTLSTGFPLKKKTFQHLESVKGAKNHLSSHPEHALFVNYDAARRSRSDILSHCQLVRASKLYESGGVRNISSLSRKHHYLGYDLRFQSVDLISQSEATVTIVSPNICETATNIGVKVNGKSEIGLTPSNPVPDCAVALTQFERCSSHRAP